MIKQNVIEGATFRFKTCITVSIVKMLLKGGSLSQKTFFEHILELPPWNQILSFILFNFLQMEQPITRKLLFKVLTFLDSYYL